MDITQKISWAITHLPPNLAERFIRAALTQPSNRLFSSTNPFSTSFNTSKTFEGHDFWYEKTKDYLDQKLKDCAPFSKKKKYPHTLFIVIHVINNVPTAFPIAYTDHGLPIIAGEQIELESPSLVNPQRISSSIAQSKTFNHLKGKHNIHIL